MYRIWKLIGVKEEKDVCGFERGYNHDSHINITWTPAKDFILLIN